VTIDGCLIKLDDYTLDQVLQRDDIVVRDALRRVVERIVEHSTDAVSGFQNYVEE
jgi:FXSXX-COOH protein